MQKITPTQSQIILQWETHQKSRDDVLQNTNEPKTKSELLQTIFAYQRRSTTRYHNIVLELSQHCAVVVTKLEVAMTTVITGKIIKSCYMPLWNLGVFDVSIGPQCSKPARARILRHFLSTWPVLRNTSGKSFRIKIIRNNPFWWLKSYSMKIIQNNSFANHSWSKTFHELLANN